MGGSISFTMKKSLSLSLLLSTALLHGAFASGFSIGGHGAYGTGDDKAGEIGGGLQLRLSLPMIGLAEAQGTWLSQEFDVASAVGRAEVDTRILALSALFELPMGKQWKPYLGGGINRVEFDSTNGFDFDDQTGYHVMGGLEYRLNKSFFIFGDYQYFWQKLRGSDPLGFAVSESVNFALVRLGGGFRF